MQPNNRPRIIGITGSIGSGKTTVSKIIEADYPVYYADTIAHQVLELDQVKNKLLSRWGEAILDKEKVNRKAIADIVFENQTELTFLNSIVHPEVLISMQDIVNKSRKDVVFFEVPLLFEANLKSCFDLVVLIVAKKQVRISRLQIRDHLSESEIQNRIDAQKADAVKSKLADLVITNDGTTTQLQDKVKQFLETVPKLPYRDVSPFA